MDYLPTREGHQAAAVLFVPTEGYVDARIFGASDHSSPCQECPCWNPPCIPSKKRTFSESRGLDCQRLCINHALARTKSSGLLHVPQQSQTLTIESIRWTLPVRYCAHLFVPLSHLIFATTPKDRYLPHFTEEDN